MARELSHPNWLHSVVSTPNLAGLSSKKKETLTPINIMAKAADFISCIVRGIY